MKPLLTGIFTAFNALPENTLHSNLGGRMYSRWAPQGTDYPYAVVHIVAAVNDPDFIDDYDDVDLQFNLISQSASEAEIGTLYENLRSLYDDTTITVAGHIFVYMQYDTSWMLDDADTTIRGWAVQYNVLVQR